MNSQTFSACDYRRASPHPTAFFFVSFTKLRFFSLTKNVDQKSKITTKVKLIFYSWRRHTVYNVVFHKQNHHRYPVHMEKGILKISLWTGQQGLFHCPAVVSQGQRADKQGIALSFIVHSSSQSNRDGDSSRSLRTLLYL